MSELLKITNSIAWKCGSFEVLILDMLDFESRYKEVFIQRSFYFEVSSFYWNHTHFKTFERFK